MSQPRSGSRAVWLAALFFGVLLIFTAVLVSPAPVAGATSNSTLAQYRAWMVEARAKYPYKQSVDKMYRVMLCESTGYSKALSRNGLYSGLFQYHKNTWRGSWNPYRSNNIFDPRSQIFATAKAWSLGMQSHWECYYLTAGR